MIYTYLVPFPNSVHEYVTETIDGDHAIYINDKLTPEAQKQAYNHALDHIAHHDFDADQDADEIEMDRHVK